mmetsp:Transcript_4328/g.8298  ORF Transcript_4328/g.8298 Transcript_4328/m.8298 type:complete len:505 (-) Transcript_4328:31-1545(-)
MKFISIFLIVGNASSLAVAFVSPSFRVSKHSLRKTHQDRAATQRYDKNGDDDEMSPEEREKFEEEVVDVFLSDYNDNDIPRNVLGGPSDFLSGFQKNPFDSSLKSARQKSTLYSDEELFRVLKLHEDLQENNEARDYDNDQNDENLDQSSPPLLGLGGIQDVIVRTLQNDNVQPPVGLSEAPKVQMIDIDEQLKSRSKGIRAIASDVDGTILTSKMSVHPRTRLALKRAIESASSWASGDRKDDKSTKNRIQYFFPATGKSRMGALDSLGIEIGNLVAQNCGGVYLQGLYCVDPNGKVVFEKKLDRSAIRAAEMLAEETCISIVGYDGDDLYTTNQTDIVRHLHEHYGEPLPVLLPPKIQDYNFDNNDIAVRKLESHEASMHKLLLMDNDVEKLTHIVRPKLEALASQHGACVTQALPTMLELLPGGCSKAMGVEKLCQALDIDPCTELLAIGDAENDAGMLRMACIGVAVGNASPPARDASDIVLEFTNDQGGAGFAIELFAL